MSTPVIVYVLTGLAAVVIVLTRLRMRGGKGAGRVYVGRMLLNLHTVAGVAGAGGVDRVPRRPGGLGRSARRAGSSASGCGGS